MLAWSNPTQPGARPRKPTFADHPLMVAVAVDSSVEYDSWVREAAAPSAGGLETGPTPVK
jgi:hypothetical protein